MKIKLNDLGRKNIFSSTEDLEFDVVDENGEFYICVPINKFNDEHVPNRVLIDKCWVSEEG